MSSRIPQSFQAVFDTVHRLRAPGGCPWDREQTHLSLRPFLIEEAYEVLDALDATGTGATAALREELGDLLLQILLHSEIASETGEFDFGQVADALNEKLIRRHPHVFAVGEGDLKPATTEAVLQNWEQQKVREKAEKAASAEAVSVLDGTPKGLPALQRTARVIDKVSKVGFQWPDLNGPLAKLDEELRELRAEVATLEGAKTGPEADAARARAEGELGDLLFSVCNVARFLKVNPEDALRGTLARFEKRFRHVEDRLRAQGRSPKDATLEEMDGYWEEAKRRPDGAR